MPRAKTILQNEFPYHVTARCRNKEWFSLPMDSVWDTFSEQLTFMTWAYGAKIHSFVLMNNHFHLIVTTPYSNINEVMAFFMRETTRSLNKKAGRINQAYGGPYFRCIIGNTHYFMNTYKYVYANPLKSGLVESCEEYKYSSLNFLLGGSYASFPVIFDDTLFFDIEGTLEWLNREVVEEAWTSVTNALGKKYFKLAKVSYGKRKNPLEKLLI